MTDPERALLGSILIDGAQLDNVLEHVHGPEMFAAPAHAKIFTAMLALKNAGQAIDIVTVADKNDPQYLAELANDVFTSAHAADYAKQVAEKHIKRELLRVCEEGKRIATSDTPAQEAAASIDALLLKATSGVNNNICQPIQQLSHQRFAKCLEDISKGTHFEGIKSGFTDIDNLIDGFAAGESIIIAARPSIGKTALALNFALNAAKAGHPVEFFSLEQSRQRLTDRLIAMESQVEAKRYRRRELTEQDMARIEKAVTVLEGLNINITDGSMNTAQIRSALARRAKPKQTLVIIDFLTLLTDHPTLSAHERYGTIAKKISSMAQEFNIPTITLAQLSRKVEERSNKRPILSDLRESGNIEEAADKVGFIYRDEYYNPQTDEPGVAEIIWAKNRDGETGMEKLTWRPEVLKFGNISWREME